MEPRNINKLLDRYFEGLSTLREEEQLRDFFRQDGEEVPEHLLPYRSLFRGLDELAGEKLDDDFDARLLRQLDAMEASGHPGPGKRVWMKRILRAAAIALIALAAWWMVPQPQPPQPQAIDWSKYEPDSPEEALQITMQALQRTSGAIQEGARATQQVKNLRSLNRITRDTDH